MDFLSMCGKEDIEVIPDITLEWYIVIFMDCYCSILLFSVTSLVLSLCDMYGIALHFAERNSDVYIGGFQHNISTCIN